MVNEKETARVIVNLDFPGGARLLGIGYAHVEFASSGGQTKRANVVVSVPQGTRAVHASVTGVELAFGGIDEPPQSDRLSSVLFQVVKHDIIDGQCELDVVASLIGAHDSALWRGIVAVEIMSFG